LCASRGRARAARRLRGRRACGRHDGGGPCRRSLAQQRLDRREGQLGVVLGGADDELAAAVGDRRERAQDRRGLAVVGDRPAVVARSPAMTNDASER
jgi:hypothetical protein